MPAKKPEAELRRITVQYRVLPSEIADFEIAAELSAKDCSRCVGGLYLAHVRGGQQEERECAFCNGTGKRPFKYSSYARDVAVEAAELAITQNIPEGEHMRLRAEKEDARLDAKELAHTLKLREKQRLERKSAAEAKKRAEKRSKKKSAKKGKR